MGIDEIVIRQNIGMISSLLPLNPFKIGWTCGHVTYIFLVGMVGAKIYPQHFTNMAPENRPGPRLSPDSSILGEAKNQPIHPRVIRYWMTWWFKTGCVSYVLPCFSCVDISV